LGRKDLHEKEKWSSVIVMKNKKKSKELPWQHNDINLKKKNPTCLLNSACGERCFDGVKIKIFQRNENVAKSSKSRMVCV
jgi:hypothetical protein